MSDLKSYGQPTRHHAPTPETAGKETLVERLRKLRAELAFGGDADAASMVGEAITQLAKAVEALDDLFAGGFIEAGTRFTVDGARNSPQCEWSALLEAKLPALRELRSTLLQIKGEKR